MRERGSNGVGINPGRNAQVLKSSPEGRYVHRIDTMLVDSFSRRTAVGVSFFITLNLSLGRKSL
jgi:hypothetical protein